jgi:hypothetical protein
VYQSKKRPILDPPDVPSGHKHIRKSSLPRDDAVLQSDVPISSQIPAPICPRVQNRNFEPRVVAEKLASAHLSVEPTLATKPGVSPVSDTPAVLTPNQPGLQRRNVFLTHCRHCDAILHVMWHPEDTEATMEPLRRNLLNYFGVWPDYDKEQLPRI